MNAAHFLLSKPATHSALAVFALLIALQFPAAPLWADDWDSCMRTSGDESISVCTRAITSGRWRGANLARAYNSRGYAYDDKGEYDRAIDDYDQAIKLDPKYAAAYRNRCATYNNKTDYDSAIAGAQRPEVWDSLVGEFVFKDNAATREALDRSGRQLERVW